MDGMRYDSRVKPWLYRSAAALLIAACLLACCAVPAQAVVAETVMVGGTLVVATVLVALGFLAFSDVRLGEVAQRIVDEAASAGVPWLTADREIAVLKFGVGVASRVAREVINWVKAWVTDPANNVLVGAWRASFAVGTVYPLTDSGYIEPSDFVLHEVMRSPFFADVWSNFNYPGFTDRWNAIKQRAKFIALGVGHSMPSGRHCITYTIYVLMDDIEYGSVKVTGISSSQTQLGAFVSPEGIGTQVYPLGIAVCGRWYDDGTFFEYAPGVLPAHDPLMDEGIVAINYGGPGLVYDGPDLLAGTIGTVYPAWNALGDANTLPLAVPDSLGGLVGVVPEQAQTVADVEITGQPESVSVAVGETATFTVTASGSGLGYQWQYKTLTADWRNSTTGGHDTPTLSVQGVLARNGYQYRCIVTDYAGNVVVSDAATLTVTEGQEPEPSPSPGPVPAPLPEEIGGLWRYVRALVEDMAAALAQVGAFVTALPPAITVPVWAAVALMVIIGLLRAFLGG